MPKAFFETRMADNVVVFWLDTRLPFEPRGEMLVARESLRSALRSMQPTPASALTATYASLDQTFCDVENVLFYNVGAAAFARTATDELSFCRQHAAPPTSPDGHLFRNYHRYEIAPPAQGRREGVCTFEFPIGSLSSSSKPHEVWWPASRAVGLNPVMLSGAFELRIELQGPTETKNLASIIKPLLDGIICALHVDQVPDQEAVRRLAARTGWAGEEIRERLASPTMPLLGERRVIHAYRDFVKWDPADELCEKCTLLRKPGLNRYCVVDVWELGASVPR